MKRTISIAILCAAIVACASVDVIMPSMSGVTWRGSGTNLVASWASGGGSVLPLTNWSHRNKITIDHTKVGGGTNDVSSFPVLIYASITGAATNGVDVRFTAEDGVTFLAREIESYATNSLLAWVKVPTLSCATDTVIYVYYGNPGTNEPAPSSTYGACSVWDSNYRGVWHLPNGTTLAALDSTINSNNASTITATATDGKINGAAAFSAQRIEFANSTSLNVVGAVTMEVWFNETSTANYRALITKGADTARSYAMFLTANATNSVYYDNVGALSLSSGWSIGIWNHLVLTDNGTNLIVYLNGATAYAGTNGRGATSQYIQTYLGYDYNSSFPMLGKLDEARVSSGVRAAPWVATEYQNQSNPTNFYTFGATE